MTIKPPPHSVEAEQAVIAACMIRSDIIPQVLNVISPADFYLEKHSLILQAMETGYQCHKYVDMLTLIEALKTSGNLEKSGGEAYLGSISESAYTSAGWKYHAEIVKECAQRRRLIFACQDTALKAEVGDLVETVSALSGSLREIGQSEKAACINNQAVLANVVDRAGSKIPPEGIQAGFSNLDDVSRLGTVEPGNTLYLAARPSIGKTDRKSVV